ncbi:MAG TPA: glucose 1-dehydrogenase [Steroidobacteraceae bacterium]|nr:glucose 1-dehydrogenase [Steroidobacteraceae bacterium]
MRALTVSPGTKDSGRLDDVPAPARNDGGVLLAPLAVGVCGTDAEILAGEYGWSPPGRDRLALGHECAARVLASSSGFEQGELVVPIVRRPDPVPCPACAAGEWDMCRNGRYTEHGIKELDGFCAEQLQLPADSLVRVPPSLGLHAVLTEPTSVVAKAWEHIERIGHRAYWSPKKVLVTGAGPVGLLAALLGRQRGLEVMVFDRVTDGPKPRLVSELGAQYSNAPIADLLKASPPDIVLECTGAAPVLIEVIQHNAPGCITCLVGVSSEGHSVPVDLGALNRSIVLDNDVVFGSVNANRRHYDLAAQALARADRAWLDTLITRRVPLAQWQSAFTRRADDVKVLLEINAS